MKKPLIVLTGPTASGKTSLAVALAKEIGGEIISGDSMQVYRQMDIGTAKVREEEKEGVPHYMIDEFDPDQECSVALFQKKVKVYMGQIYDRGKIPIIVGGTGFYIRAITHDIEFEDMDTDTSIRDQLMEEAKVHGPELLHDQLALVDPVSAENIHKNNIQRVVRALEYHRQTGQPISQHNQKEKMRQTPYNLVFFALNMDRDLLYSRINTRVDQMLEEGLLQEARRIFDKGYPRELPSMRGIGYKEFYDYFEGTEDLDSSIARLKQNTRHYAKRQLTWLRNQSEPTWINVDDYHFNKDQILALMLSHIKEKGIVGQN